MKVALVNLCKIEDISLQSSFNDDILFLKENSIEYIDYASGRDTKETLLKGFHDAIKDESVGLIWFTQGGSTLIKFIEDIDWSLVVSTNKKFMGLSDFTHFSTIAVSKSITCYYGLALKKIKNYYSENHLKKIADFVKLISGQSDFYDPTFSYSVPNNNKIIGGHLTSFLFIQGQYNVGISNMNLFIEHHYVPGETFEDLEYYIDQLLLTIKQNKPLSIILGHTILFNEDGVEIDYKEINKFLVKKVGDINIPISEVNHFLQPIQLG